MGCCCGATKKPEMFNSGKGTFPKKIMNVRNGNVIVLDTVYLFGGDKVLKFDTRTKTISPVNDFPSSLKVPRKTSTHYLTPFDKVVILGGQTSSGALSQDCYLFSPPNFAKYQKLPDYPFPVMSSALIYHDGYLYSIGGEIEGPAPNNITKEVYRLRVSETSFGNSWEKFVELPIQRRSAMCLVSHNIIHVFGGYSGKAESGAPLRSTEVDCINIADKKVIKQGYRLPIGVEGAGLAWHGDKILLIGGRRISKKPDANVLLMNFKRKTILSTRDLKKAREYPIVCPTSIDEVVVIGGSKYKNSEKRVWNQELGDYEFQEVYIQGQDLMEDTSVYSSALPAFIDDSPPSDSWPDLHATSTIIFGNEIDCFLVEVPEDLGVHFYYSPMKLQQKTGQRAIRYDSNTIYLVAGTDVTRHKVSQKAYKFTLHNKSIVELARLNEHRYFPAFVNAGSDFYVIGGKGSHRTCINSVEKLSMRDENGERWTTVAPMKTARMGHVAWTANGKIFVIGGTSMDKGKPYDSLETYDIDSNTWEVSRDFRMEPALSGAAIVAHKNWVYIVGGQGQDDVSVNSIYRIDRFNPTSMVLAASMKAFRVDPFAFIQGKNLVVMGGSDEGLMEAFDAETLKPVENIGLKSQSFFKQLECYTTDVRLENMSVA